MFRFLIGLFILFATSLSAFGMACSGCPTETNAATEERSVSPEQSSCERTIVGGLRAPESCCGFGLACLSRCRCCMEKPSAPSPLALLQAPERWQPQIRCIALSDFTFGEGSPAPDWITLPSPPAFYRLPLHNPQAVLQVRLL